MTKSPARLVLLAVMLGCATTLPAPRVHGQWDKKPYRQWTSEEAEAVLIESPWAQTVYPAAVVNGQVFFCYGQPTSETSFPKFEFDVAKMMINGQVVF
jgi:hypothetical protein